MNERSVGDEHATHSSDAHDARESAAPDATHISDGNAASSRAASGSNFSSTLGSGLVVAGKAVAQLGDYDLIEPIGEGGMGQVFKAQHRKMKRTVALKVLPPDISANSKSLHRFHREVEAAAQLSHPNIVTAYDARDENGIHYLVMEFVEGEDLANRVCKQGALPTGDAVEFVIQAARGLEYAHQKGIIHRDIKPSNLIVDADGVVKILDLGLARLSVAALEPDAPELAADLTPKESLMGTAAFMAPEQAEDATKADLRADIYSLGCTLFFLLTGRTPYGGDTMMLRILAHRNDPIPSLCALRPHLNPQLDTVFSRMVAKPVSGRFATMGEVIHELVACRQAGLEVAAASEANSGAASPSAGAEQRAYARRSANCVVICRLADVPDAQDVRGRTVNISQSGACVTVPMELQKGSAIAIDFLGKSLVLRSIVQWVTSQGPHRCTVGCKFETVITHGQLVRLTL